MNIEALIPSLLVAYTMWSTPGPNNMMLMYSGARFGVWATAPHVMGIVLGTCILNYSAIAGLKPIIDRWPQLLLVLKVLGSIWLVWIGIKMIRAQRKKGEDGVEQPMTLTAAAVFQFANPKAITATLALASLVLVTLDEQPNLWWVMALAIPLLSICAIIPWVLAGKVISRWLSTPLHWRVFSWATGLLTGGCAIFLWI